LTRSAEVQAARTSKEQGVRLIASAHGDLPSLVCNEELDGVVGKVDFTTLGDKLAREEARKVCVWRGWGVILAIKRG
jgi:stage III sporulation protein SpoIIIAA